MALAYYDAADFDVAPLHQPDATLPEETGVHVRTYRKFVVFARAAAFCAPLLLAFALYWTT